MRHISIAVLAGVLALAGTAHADDTPSTPPVDREAAMARAPQFTAKMDAALSQPIATLYQAALGNDPEAAWTYGLAMDAKRDNMESVPPAQRDIYVDYAKRVHEARSQYEQKHKNTDTSDMTMDEFVKPTDAEQQAVLLVHAIHDPEYWFGKVDHVRTTIDPLAVQQSRQCLKAVIDNVSADDLMRQMMGAIAVPKDGKTDSDGMSMSDLMTSLGDKNPTDEDLDHQALCGGKDAYVHDKTLMKAIYQPEFTISVTKGKN